MSPRSRTRIYAGDGDPRHGTVNGYSNLRCNCDECRAAWRTFCYQESERRKAIGLPDPDDPRHGTINGYGNWGCRCRPCTTAWSTDTVSRARRYRAEAS